MRLGCPKCYAQYEVADSLIPAGGRDVQCSACNHTWFVGADGEPVAADPVPVAASKVPPPPEPEAASVAVPAAPPGPEWPAKEPNLSEPEPQVDLPPTPAPEPEPEIPDDVDNADDAHDLDATLSGISALMAAQSAQPPPVARPSLSESAAAVLREEAARESAARRAEAEAALQTQGELGLESAQRPGRAAQTEEARRRMAQLRGDPAESAAPPPETAARRTVFPDIEAINSTLRPGGEGAENMVIYPEDIDHKRGRRAGFTTVLLIFVILALLYLFADRITRAVPPLSPVLDRYVTLIDDGRLWLDLQLQGLLGRDAATASAPDALPETIPAPPPDAPVPDVGTTAPDLAPAPEADAEPAGN
jgi:predicted Zn finger-like uncharacterized protein